MQERSAALRVIAEAETEAARRAEANALRETGEEEQSPEQASVRILHICWAGHRSEQSQRYRNSFGNLLKYRHSVRSHAV